MIARLYQVVSRLLIERPRLCAAAQSKLLRFTGAFTKNRRPIEREIRPFHGVLAVLA
jgi:hypothetical protein